MQTAAQDIGLEAGLALERDKAGLHRSLGADELFHNADLVVGNVADNPGPEEYADRNHNDRDDHTDDGTHRTSFPYLLPRGGTPSLIWLALIYAALLERLRPLLSVP